MVALVRLKDVERRGDSFKRLHTVGGSPSPLTTVQYIIFSRMLYYQTPEWTWTSLDSWA